MITESVNNYLVLICNNMSNTFIVLDKSYGSLCWFMVDEAILSRFSANISLIVIFPKYLTPTYKVGLSGSAEPRDSISNIYHTNKI